jgi:hypothetical protein
MIEEELAAASAAKNIGCGSSSSSGSSTSSNISSEGENKTKKLEKACITARKYRSRRRNQLMERDTKMDQIKKNNNDIKKKINKLTALINILSFYLMHQIALPNILSFLAIQLITKEKDDLLKKNV